MKQAECLSKDEFIRDETLKTASVRGIEIIAKVVKKIPDDFKQKYAHIEWGVMAGMRDKLIHAYLCINYDIVWDVGEKLNKSLGVRKTAEV